MTTRQMLRRVRIQFSRCDVVCSGVLRLHNQQKVVQMQFRRRVTGTHVSSAMCSSVCSMYVEARCTVKSLKACPLYVTFSMQSSA